MPSRILPIVNLRSYLNIVNIWWHIYSSMVSVMKRNFSILSTHGSSASTPDPDRAVVRFMWACDNGRTRTTTRMFIHINDMCTNTRFSQHANNDGIRFIFVQPNYDVTQWEVVQHILKWYRAASQAFPVNTWAFMAVLMSGFIRNTKSESQKQCKNTNVPGNPSKHPLLP